MSTVDNDHRLFLSSLRSFFFKNASSFLSSPLPFAYFGITHRIPRVLFWAKGSLAVPKCEAKEVRRRKAISS